MDLKIKNIVNYEDYDSDIFLKNMDSKLVLNIDRNIIIDDEEWLDMVEFTMPYILKALNKPNKNIITEEEVVKIELIKKVTVESIKHLSKNTNLIAEYDEKTEDVVPSKILNAYKEENFITYENRFIYSLIKLIDDFIFIRTREKKAEDFKGKNYQKANFEATSRVRREKVTLNFEYTASSETTEEKQQTTQDRIINLKKSIKTLKATDMFKLMEEKRATLVKSPLKMTNVLLKNVNFQYCVKLWQYLNDHLDEQSKSVKKEANFEDKGLVRELINEDFFVKYMIFKKINTQLSIKENLRRIKLDKEHAKEITDQLIERIIDINPDLAEQELKRMIIEKYIIYKKSKEISLKPLEEAFTNEIGKYLKKISKNRL